MASLTGFIAFMVFVAALFQGTTAQTSHIVGGNLGWRVPDGDTNAYSSWAAKQTFSVGDTLVFNFVTTQHDVANVTKTVYDACNTSPAPNSLKTGPANVNLTSEGDHYFICTVGPHCRLGQKVKISVNSSSGTTTPPGTPGGTTTNPKSAASTLTIINFSMLVSVAIAFLY